MAYPYGGLINYSNYILYKKMGHKVYFKDRQGNNNQIKKVYIDQQLVYDGDNPQVIVCDGPNYRNTVFYNDEQYLNEYVTIYYTLNGNSGATSFIMTTRFDEAHNLKDGYYAGQHFTSTGTTGTDEPITIDGVHLIKHFSASCTSDWAPIYYSSYSSYVEMRLDGIEGGFDPSTNALRQITVILSTNSVGVSCTFEIPEFNLMGENFGVALPNENDSYYMEKASYNFDIEHDDLNSLYLLDKREGVHPSDAGYADPASASHIRIETDPDGGSRPILGIDASTDGNPIALTAKDETIFRQTGDRGTYASATSHYMSFDVYIPEIPLIESQSDYNAGTQNNGIGLRGGYYAGPNYAYPLWLSSYEHKATSASDSDRMTETKITEYPTATGNHPKVNLDVGGNHVEGTTHGGSPKGDYTGDGWEGISAASIYNFRLSIGGGNGQKLAVGIRNLRIDGAYII